MSGLTAIGDNNNETTSSHSTLGANNIQWLTNHLTSLYRKEITEKPTKFNKEMSFENHINELEKYMKIVKVEDDIGKICLLLESLGQAEKDELLFEPEYEENSSSYKWHTTKLRALFPSKGNKTVDLVDLFNLKQQGMSFSDFASSIKSEILKRKYYIDKNDYQKIALKIFLAGFDDNNLSNAIKAQKPQTIGEALDMLKRVKKQESQDKICAANYKQNNETDDLKKQIAYLTQLVLSLQSKMTSLFDNKNERAQLKTTQSLFCKYCKRSGHSESRCRRKEGTDQRPKCYNCNRAGHFARDCRAPRRVNQINWHQGESYGSSFNVNSNNSCQSIDDQPQSVNCAQINSILIDRDEKLELNNSNNTINRQRVHAPRIPKKHTARPFPQQKHYPTDIINDCEYIEGTRSMNSKGCTFSEVLQNAMTIRPTVEHKKDENNRPILSGRLSGTNTNFFMDTGSEINVIDQMYLNRLLNKQVTLCKNSSKVVSCANGSKLKINGSVSLLVQIGPSEKLLNFLVASTLYPKVIIGIHGMQSLSLNIDLKNSEVITQGVRVPFKSRILSESELLQKNGFFLYDRTGVQDKSQV